MRANIVSAALVVIPTLCYVGVAINEAMRGDWKTVVVFAGYSFANCGLVWGLWK